MAFSGFSGFSSGFSSLKPVVTTASSDALKSPTSIYGDLLKSSTATKTKTIETQTDSDVDTVSVQTEIERTVQFRPISFANKTLVRCKAEGLFFLTRLKPVLYTAGSVLEVCLTDLPESDCASAVVTNAHSQLVCGCDDLGIHALVKLSDEDLATKLDESILRGVSLNTDVAFVHIKLCQVLIEETVATIQDMFTILYEYIDQTQNKRLLYAVKLLQHTRCFESFGQIDERDCYIECFARALIHLINHDGAPMHALNECMSTTTHLGSKVRQLIISLTCDLIASSYGSAFLCQQVRDRDEFKEACYFAMKLAKS
jgi:hypothetical protein